MVNSAEMRTDDANARRDRHGDSRPERRRAHRRCDERRGTAESAPRAPIPLLLVDTSSGAQVLHRKGVRARVIHPYRLARRASVRSCAGLQSGADDDLAVSAQFARRVLPQHCRSLRHETGISIVSTALKLH